MFPIKPLARDLLGSFAKMTPVFFIKAAICVVLPPGAEAICITKQVKNMIPELGDMGIVAYIKTPFILLRA